MIGITRYLVALFLLLSLSACVEEEVYAPQTESVENTLLTLNAYGKQYYVRLLNPEKNMVVAEATNWKHELLYRSHYYRGLLLAKRKEGKKSWEIQADMRPVDTLFPLAVGKRATLKGEIRDLPTGEAAPYTGLFKVLGKKIVHISKQAYTVFKIEIVQTYEGKHGEKSWSQIVYHAPALSINVKGMFTEKGEKKYWRVTDVEKSVESIEEVQTRPRRRAGTVLI